MPYGDSGLPKREFSLELEVSQLEGSSDEQLMEFIKLGCTDAMTPLYRRHCRLLAGIAYSILHDYEEAREIVQEIFLQAFRKAHFFDPVKGGAKLWLMSIAYRLSLNRRKYLIHRRYYNKQQLSSRNGNGHELEYNSDLFNALALEERIRIIKNGIARLPDKQKRAIELTCFDSLLMKDVAVRMGETLINACNHYYRGLRRLRQIVDEMLLPQSAAAANGQAQEEHRRASQTV